MSSLPDRSHILTEQRNPRSISLHSKSVEECVRLINAEDAAVHAAIELAAPKLSMFISSVEPGFRAGGRLVYVGAGTSGRLGVLDASECPPTFCVPPDRVIGIIAGGDSALRRSSEGKEDELLGAAPELDALKLGSNDAVLGIAAGGTTPYVLGAIEHVKRAAKANAAPVTGLLVCSPIPQPPSADHLIVLETGPEVLTGSTRMKAGSATKMALNIISTTLMTRSGRVYQNLMVDMRATNDKLRDRAARVISTLTNLSRDDALALLDRANGFVKTAVVMHARGVDAPSAERLLQDCAGRLDSILG